MVSLVLKIFTRKIKKTREEKCGKKLICPPQFVCEIVSYLYEDEKRCLPERMGNFCDRQDMCEIMDYTVPHVCCIYLEKFGQNYGKCIPKIILGGGCQNVLGKDVK
jgi:hypothetical protein